MAAEEELTSARGAADADPGTGGEADRREITWNRRKEFEVRVLNFDSQGTWY